MLLAQLIAMPMIRRTLTVVSLLCALTGVSLTSAQGQTYYDTSAAEAEAILRAEASILLNRKLSEASSSEARGDIEQALKEYNEALEYAQRIGEGVNQIDQSLAVSGVSRNAMIIANRAIAVRDFDQASSQINRVLKIDPTNAEAQALKPSVEASLESIRGKRPSAEVLSKLPAIREQKLQAQTLVQDARVLIDAGKLEEAQTILEEAQKLDPSSQAALYFLNIVREKMYSLQIQKNEAQFKTKINDIASEKSWPVNKDGLSIPNTFAYTNLVHTSKGRSRILNKLNKLVIKEVFFDGIPLSEVVTFLKEESKSRDIDGEGLNFMINPFVDNTILSAFPSQTDEFGQPVANTASFDVVDIKSVTIEINPPLSNITFADLLDAISKVASSPIKWSLEDYAVVFSQKTAQTSQLFTRFFQINPNTFQQGLANVIGIPFGAVDNAQGGGGGGAGGGGGGGGGGSTVDTLVNRVSAPLRAETICVKGRMTNIATVNNSPPR